MSTIKTNMTSAQLQEASMKLRREYERQQKEYKKRIREAKTKEAREAKAKRDAELIQLGLEYEQIKQSGGRIEDQAAIQKQYDAMLAFLMKERNSKDGETFQYWTSFVREHPGAFPDKSRQ